MKLLITDFTCKICGKHKKQADHSSCSQKLQELRNKEQKKSPNVASKRVYSSGKSGEYFSRFF